MKTSVTIMASPLRMLKKGAVAMIIISFFFIIGVILIEIRNANAVADISLLTSGKMKISYDGGIMPLLSVVFATIIICFQIYFLKLVNSIHTATQLEQKREY